MRKIIEFASVKEFEKNECTGCIGLNEDGNSNGSLCLLLKEANPGRLGSCENIIWLPLDAAAQYRITGKLPS
jgi:hypothetical protein